MKYLLKGLIVLVICMERALAISPIAYRNHIGQVRMNSPGIGNVILSDGTRYEESIQEIEGIVAREGKLPQPLPLDNLNSLTPAYWNLIVLSKYVKEMFTRSPGGGNCNSQGIDNLRLDLNRTYTGHEYDINVAIEDTKRHCNFINLYLPLNEMIGQPRQGQFLNRESNDWKRRSPQRLSGMPDVNVQYSLRNYEVEEFENVESLTGQHCNEVRIHPYDGYGQIGNGDFNARIPMTQQLAERIRNELGQYQVLGQDFIFSVESPDLIGNNPGEMSLKPQWAFERFYNGYDEWL
ncbi:MAG: hypothetical protein LBU35_01600 [Holosporales bacterium]|jgi:hypothetical protein|nr:hypothetical protein [Holosporales bacterium]